MKKALIVAFAGVLSMSGLGLAQTNADTDKTFDQLFGEHKPYAQFFGKLQKAVAANDKKAVAAMVDYPFQVRVGGKALKIRDAAHFVADYDKVVTAKIKNAVARQTYADLFANWQGVMIGDGEVWFSGIGEKNDIRIIAINE